MKKYIYATVAFIGFLMLAAECEDMNAFYLSKVLGMVLFAGPLYLSGALKSKRTPTNKNQKYV